MHVAFAPYLQGLLQTVLVSNEGFAVFRDCVNAHLSWWSFLCPVQYHAVCSVPDASVLVLPHCQAAHQGRRLTGTFKGAGAPFL